MRIITSIIFSNKLESVIGLYEELTDFSSSEDLNNGIIKPKSHDKRA